jgi:hypothetical protein
MVNEIEQNIEEGIRSFQVGDVAHVLHFEELAVGDLFGRTRAG